jgi:hypothetical protein
MSSNIMARKIPKDRIVCADGKSRWEASGLAT